MNTILSTLLVLLPPVGQAEPDPATTPIAAVEDPVERARRIASELARFGYPIDLERLAFATKTPEGCYADLDAQQDLLTPPGRFELAHRFLSGLGLPAGDDPAQLRAEVVRAFAQAFPAYYQVGANELVFVENTAARLDAGLGGLDRLVAHELVHAHQEQQAGVVRLLTERKTSEDLRVVHVLMEGEAELVSTAWQLGSTDPDDLELEDASEELARMLSGEALVAVYGAGRRFLLERYRAGGFEAVRGVFADLPASTEQILHPAKLGLDRPTPVELPELPLATVVQDVQGELETYRVLLALGEPRASAWPAAAGWDGDSLWLGRGANGEEAVVWRTLWDREEDAAAFARVLENRAQGKLLRSWRRVDWYRCSDDELAREVEARLGASPPAGAPEPSDGASTAAAEAAFAAALARGSVAVGGRWTFPEHGLSLPIPEGFAVVEVNGVRVLQDTLSDANFRSNINVQVTKLPAASRIEDLVEPNRREIEDFDLEVLALDVTRIAGRGALDLEYAGRFPGAPFDMHFVAVLILDGRKQIVVTGTAAEEDWEAHGPLLRRALAGIELGNGE